MDSLAIIQRLAGGLFIDRLAFALTEVSERVAVTHNKGSVTVTFAIKEWPEGEPSVLIEETIKTAPSPNSPRGAVFFAIGNGALEITDPRKPELPGFRRVDMPNNDPIVLSDMEVSRG